MPDPEVSDYAVQPGVAPQSSPPSVKISRDWSFTVIVVAVISAIVVPLIVGKLSEVAYVGLLSGIIGAIMGAKKPEGVVGEATLMNLMKRE